MAQDKEAANSSKEMEEKMKVEREKKKKREWKETERRVQAVQFSIQCPSPQEQCHHDREILWKSAG
jgi:hypothetical protein